MFFEFYKTTRLDLVGFSHMSVGKKMKIPTFPRVPKNRLILVYKTTKKPFVYDPYHSNINHTSLQKYFYHEYQFLGAATGAAL